MLLDAVYNKRTDFVTLPPMYRLKARSTAALLLCARAAWMASINSHTAEVLLLLMATLENGGGLVV